MNVQERKAIRKIRKARTRRFVFTALIIGFILGVVSSYLFSQNYDIKLPDSKKAEIMVSEQRPELEEKYSDKEKTVTILTQEQQNTISAYNKTVVIDAGHQQKGNFEKEPIGPGASETKPKVAAGTSGVSTKTPEYKVNLEVSLRLRDILAEKGYNVIMIRETNDVNISNSDRAKIANANNADAFIRLHCNGSEDSNAKGALTMCQTQNNPYCGDLHEKSRLLSEKVIEALCKETGAASLGVSETDSMSGINWCSVPVTIVEMGFMTNPEEDNLLSDSPYQEKLAIGIANGIDNYFADLT